jgi:GWxTD domain-containing protein
MSKEQTYWSFLSARHLFLSISYLLVWGVCFGQEESLNTLDLYQTDAPINCRFSLLDQGDSLWIFAALEFKQKVKDSSLWIKTSWTTGNQIIQDSVQLRRENNRRSVMKWGFTPQTLPNLFTLELNWKARTLTFQEHFPMSAFHPSGGLSLRDSSNPIVTGWIHSRDSILINTVENKKVFAYFYDHEFDPARPPMTLRPGKGSGTLDIDTILVLIPDQNFTPGKPGLYFFQTDSSSTLGTALFVPDNHYPQPQEIKELTEPLIYITTKGEYQKISKDLTSKQALDKFWLSTVGSPENARRAIKNFYHNIEVANKLFTSYKEGWKTDRGMIYTVMGPPLSVVKGLETETWSYRDIANEEMKFEFKKIRNIFSNNHYELVRDKSYDRQWFLAIDRWREGKTK